MSVLPATAGPSAYWYLTRSTGAVAMVLLTLTLAVGVLDVQRYATARWPRFVIDGLHRNVALLTMVFLVLHIVTSVLDSFAPIALLDAVVPFVGSYRPFWLGLGAVSFDLLVAVTITSVVRRRVGHRTWRAVHWLSYASWPVALLHGFGTGSDVKGTWLMVLSLLCLAVVVLAVIARAAAGWRDGLRLRGAALAATAAFAGFLAVWLPSGPLGSEWARRSGTPTTLLPASKGAKASTKGAR